jgi:hypothetical protein
MICCRSNIIVIKFVFCLQPFEADVSLQSVTITKVNLQLQVQSVGKMQDCLFIK